MPPSPPWTAEHEITPEQVRGLLAAQFPALKVRSLEKLGEGFDNLVYGVNGELAFRFPRRQVAVAWFETEQRLLPQLAPLLPLPIPCPSYRGKPGLGYPWPFSGAPWLPGSTACSLDLSPAQRSRLAPALGHFLGVLHGLEPSDFAPLPTDELRRTDLGYRLERARGHFAQLEDAGLLPSAAPWLEALEASARRSHPSPREVLLHGDLYARHLLLDAHTQLAGIIDWGDIHLGDPALDLALAHAFLPPTAHHSFLEAYGPTPEETWHMARFRALYHTASVVVYASSVGEDALLREGLWGLENLVAG